MNKQTKKQVLSDIEAGYKSLAQGIYKKYTSEDRTELRMLICKWISDHTYDRNLQLIYERNKVAKKNRKIKQELNERKKKEKYENDLEEFYNSFQMEVVEKEVKEKEFELFG